jgi:hypothetical protein
LEVDVFDESAAYDTIIGKEEAASVGVINESVSNTKVGKEEMPYKKQKRESQGIEHSKKVLLYPFLCTNIALLAIVLFRG